MPDQIAVSPFDRDRILMVQRDRPVIIGEIPLTCISGYVCCAAAKLRFHAVFTAYGFKFFLNASGIFLLQRRRLVLLFQLFPDQTELTLVFLQIRKLQQRFQRIIFPCSNMHAELAFH